MNSAMICRVVMTVLSTLRTVVHLRTLNRCWRPMTDEDHALSGENGDLLDELYEAGDPNEDVKEEWKA